MDITRKTPGVLIDELITTKIKLWLLDKKDEPLSRKEVETRDFLDRRIFLLCGGIDKLTNLHNLGKTILKLITNDIECFFAQEELFECDRNNDKIKAGQAALDTQRFNAQRSKYLRRIDEILGFNKITLTKKTYGNE